MEKRGKEKQIWRKAVIWRAGDRFILSGILSNRICRGLHLLVLLRDIQSLEVAPRSDHEEDNVTTKSLSERSPGCEDDETIKNLNEKLAAALSSISVKEELVRQHATVTVAEEAVLGWEKAEKEVSSLRHQLDALVMKNSSLENKVSHLDGALKECVRQLRQAKEEQEEKLCEAII